MKKKALIGIIVAAGVAAIGVYCPICVQFLSISDISEAILSWVL